MEGLSLHRLNPNDQPMRPQLALIGSGLAGISFAALLGYVITAQTSAIQNPPTWPYALCGGLTLLGGLLYAVGHASPHPGNRDRLDAQEQNDNPAAVDTILGSTDQPKPSAIRSRGGRLVIEWTSSSKPPER